jgi:hypothetical protein
MSRNLNATAMLEPRNNHYQPDFATLRAALNQDVFVPVAFASPALDELLAEIRATHVNGGAEFAMFELRTTPPVNWYLARNRFGEIGFFEHLLQSAAFRAALPKVAAPEGLGALEWQWSSSYVFDGDLAQLLMAGGAYEKTKKSGPEAKQLGAAVCESLFGDRYEEVMLFKTFKPWGPWFCDVAWDATWVGVDKGAKRIWVLCVTDTD